VTGVQVPRSSGGTESSFSPGNRLRLWLDTLLDPMLVTILVTVASTQTAPCEAVLLLLYSLGLGIPFIALALGFHYMKGSMDWLQRNAKRVERISGAVLIVVGVLLNFWSAFGPRENAKRRNLTRTVE